MVNGITQQSSNTYTPQQNGVAERANRTLIEGARTLLLANAMPKRLWPKAVIAAASARNMVLSSQTDAIPEVLFNQVAPRNYNKVIPFGKRLYVHVPAEHRKKLDAKAEAIRYLGPSQGKKGLSFFTDDGKVLDSRDYRDCPADSSMTPEAHIEPAASSSKADISATVKEQRPSRTRNTVIRFADQHFSYSAKATEDELPVLLDPPTYESAMNSSQCEKWQQAMESEYSSLIENQTWELRPLPRGRKSIGAKWVFKTKVDKNGELARHKARYVAKGFRQMQGIDYDETFAPTVNKTSLRLLIAIAASNGWPLDNLDAMTAFLNGVMDKDVFIDQPKGFEVTGKNGERLYCHLKKAIYGLKQAGRTWWQAIQEYLISLGFVTCSSDTCLFVRTRGSTIVIIRL